MSKNVKTISSIIILILIYILINFICINKSYAITQTTSADINSINSNQYPQIKEILQNLKTEHPNWNFKILYTDIEWSEAIANEYVGHGSSPRNLVPANNSRYDSAWICPACGATKTYDSGKWYCASEAAIAYMMDPRNSTNNDDIFQFMELTYTESNIQTIKSMVNNTFLNNDSYINAILEAAKKYNVNAYYVIARILQEQGTSGSVLCAGNGYNGQYVGFYNVFNIGASGNGKENIILNGLKRAQDKGWNTIEASIIGGTEIISQSYIAKGQNTLYFQKFDVENSDGNLYWHQYMQNILAAQSEGETLKATFEKMGTINGEYTFIIPLFKNMPQQASTRPLTTSTLIQTTNTELVKINVTGSLRLRNAPNGSTTVGWVYKDEIVTRIEKATSKVNGTYWDKVRKSDGTEGYAARETYESESTYKLYLVPIEPTPPAKEPEENNETEENNTSSTTTVKNEKIKIDTVTNNVTAIPGTTVKEFSEFTGKEVTVKNSNGDILNSNDKFATGYKIDDTYTISVLGDVNGDGEINSGDLFNTQKYLLKKVDFDEYTKQACDVNNDSEINSGDLFFIQKYLLQKTEFSI